MDFTRNWIGMLIGVVCRSGLQVCWICGAPSVVVEHVLFGFMCYIIIIVRNGVVICFLSQRIFEVIVWH